MNAILTKKMVELDFLVNIKVVRLCLIFSTRYNMLNLDISSEGYAQITEGCSSMVLQWEELGSNRHLCS